MIARVTKSSRTSSSGSTNAQKKSTNVRGVLRMNSV